MELKHIYFVELSVDKKAAFVCDIAEKLFKENNSVHIYCKEKRDLNRLDQLLWTWKQDSFVPHALVETAGDEPVYLSAGVDQLPGGDALVMFDPVEQDVIKKYKYVVDFAETFDNAKKQESRVRYKAAMRLQKDAVSFVQLGAFLNASLQSA